MCSLLEKASYGTASTSTQYGPAPDGLGLSDRLPRLMELRSVSSLRPIGWARLASHANSCISF